MSKVPAQIEIMGKWHEFEYKDDKEMPDDYGQYKAHDEKILIRKEKDQTMFEASIHELFHALLEQSGLTIVLDDKMEEAVCHVSEHLARYLKWNQESEYVDYINKSQIK